MFSGIIETTSSLIHTQKLENTIQIRVQKPEFFDDLKIGDSICVNGVCLTVEEFDSNCIQFSLGEETLKITGWDIEIPKSLNLERSLKLSDRVHGHIVTGHVDAIGKVVDLNYKSETLEFTIEIPNSFLNLIWNKGSLCLNGVSLTINQIKNNHVSFYLIPETLKKTNFSSLKINDKINLEFDVMAKILLRQKELKSEYNS